MKKLWEIELSQHLRISSVHPNHRLDRGRNDIFLRTFTNHSKDQKRLNRHCEEIKCKRRQGITWQFSRAFQVRAKEQRGEEFTEGCRSNKSCIAKTQMHNDKPR